MIAVAIGFALACAWLQQQAGLPSAAVMAIAAAVGAAALVCALFVAPQTTVVAGRRSHRPPPGSPPRIPRADRPPPTGGGSSKAHGRATANGRCLAPPPAAGPPPLRAGAMAGRRLAAQGLFLLAGLGLGLAWASWRAEARLADALPAVLEGRDVVVEGHVATLPQWHERGVRFGFEVAASRFAVPQRLMLTWYTPAPTVDGPSPPPQVHVGERWRMTVRLRRIHGNANPQGFDYEAWMLESGWRASGYVRPGGAQRIGDAEAAPLRFAVDRMRESIRARFADTLGEDAPWRAVLTALAIGDQGAIAQAQWRLFAATGITHLISISGLHVTMLAALAYLALGAAWRVGVRRGVHRAAWLGWVPRHLVAGAGAAATACAYAALAGFAVPAQRTLYMLGASALMLALRREVTAGQVLACALLAVLLVDPWAVLAAGFWLSFGAVAVLLYSARGTNRTGWRANFATWLHSQWAVTLGSLPLLLALFQQASLVSPLANAVAIPLVSLVVTPLVLAALVPGLEFLLQVAHALFVPLAALLEWLASWPGACWQQAAPLPLHLLLAMLGSALLLLPRGTRIRWLGLIGFLPLFLYAPARPADGEALVRVLDVGQGLAVHVQTANHDLIFDTGPAFSDETDTGTRVLVPYLRALGVGKVDLLVLSHADRDHAGGALSLARELRVSAVRHSLPDDDAVLAGLLADAPDRSVTRCLAATHWAWDGVAFDELHPAAGVQSRKDNAMSCVLRVASGARSVLITSDIEAAQELALIAANAPLATDVLLVPHHGSRTSSTPEFVAATSARDVIFPVGYRNRFGHPRADIVERYAASGARLHRTDRDGAISFRLAPDVVPVPQAQRVERQRYWHGR